jgi:putative ABC transport system ATP-binding protein
MMITLAGVTKSYTTPAGAFTALESIDLQIPAGEMVAIVGRSGSGKSTLLNLIAGIDRPTRGSVHVAGSSLEGLGHDALAAWRGRHVGVVFQFFQLLPTLTVAENVMLPMDFAGLHPERERREIAIELLAQVGVADQADKLPATLSGGQQQRVAIARALANDPPLIVADEPTGNLDSATAAEVLALFRSLAESGRTVAIVTHEREAIIGASRVITLVDGRLA